MLDGLDVLNVLDGLNGLAELNGLDWLEGSLDPRARGVFGSTGLAAQWA
jgi:hypothetical protein